MRRHLWAVAALLLATAALGISACGDDDDEGGGGGGGGETGGSITIGTVGPDNADPVLFQTLQAVQVFQLGYVPLLTYAHKEKAAGADVVPGLAEDVPEP